MKKYQFRLIKIIVCLGFVFFCGEAVLLAQTIRRKAAVNRGVVSKKPKKLIDVNAQTAPGGADSVANPKLQPDAQVAVFETDYGEIVIELYPKLAPQMVERFKKLVKENFYNQTNFHRISPSLGIIQGGDPNSKDANPANDGFGKSAYPNVPAENSDILYTRGIVGAARMSDLNTANCQFFIMLKRQTLFDQKYTIFGRVIRGLSNVYIISVAPVARGTERPEDPVIVNRASLQPRKKFIADSVR